MCGVGGAVFAIPLLMRFANHSQRFAAGNSLVAVTCIAATAATSFCTQKDVNVDIPVAASLGIPAALATPIGAVAARYVSGSGLRKALGTFMLILAPLMPLREHLESTRGENGDKRQSEMGMRVMGGIVGMASGLLGISGGSLFTPLIAVSCPDLSFKSVLGTSFAAMLLPTAIGALSYARMGLVSVNVVPRLVLGAVGGGVIGSAAALAVPDEQLRWGFACVFAIMGLRTLRAPVKPASAVRNATAAG